MKINILSLGQLLEKGYEIKIKDRSLTLLDTKEVEILINKRKTLNFYMAILIFKGRREKNGRRWKKKIINVEPTPWHHHMPPHQKDFDIEIPMTQRVGIFCCWETPHRPPKGYRRQSLLFFHYISYLFKYQIISQPTCI